MKFPTTTIEFALDQSRRLGSEVGDDYMELFAAYVPLFNKSYEDGQLGDVEALLSSLYQIDKLIAQNNSPVVDRWLTVSRQWIITAWQQGATTRK